LSREDHIDLARKIREQRFAPDHFAHRFHSNIGERMVDGYRFQLRIDNPQGDAARSEPGLDLLIDLARAVVRGNDFNRKVRRAGPVSSLRQVSRNVGIAYKGYVGRTNRIGIGRKLKPRLSSEPHAEFMTFHVIQEHAVDIADNAPMLPTARRHDTQFSQDKLVPLSHSRGQG
jgi:hypothetical protein